MGPEGGRRTLAPEVALALPAGHVLEDGRGAGDVEDVPEPPDRRPVAQVFQDKGLDGLENVFSAGVTCRILFTILFTISKISLAKAFVQEEKPAP